MAADDKQSGRKDMVEAVQGVLQAVPIYQDAVQPAAREFGEGLSHIMRLAFTPVRRFHAYVEYGDAKLARRLQERLQDTAPERLVEPKVSLALPALLGWASTEAEEPVLADMYASLLATAMDAETAQNAHPAYAHLIGQMVPDEALLLKHSLVRVNDPLRLDYDLADWVGDALCRRLAEDAGVAHPDLADSYVLNLSRLGLLEHSLESVSAIHPPTQDDEPDAMVALARVTCFTGATYHRDTVCLTMFCFRFLDACLPERSRPDGMGQLPRRAEEEGCG